MGKLPIGTRVVAIRTIVDSNPGEKDAVLLENSIGFVVGHQQAKYDHFVLFVPDIQFNETLSSQIWAIPREDIGPKDNNV